MHVLPQLRKLEDRFPNEMVVVGVHSPKFPAERSTEDVRQACLRLGVEHPVVSDPDMRMWAEYGVVAWPTLMLVDPTGNVIGKSEGEVRAEEFEPVIESMLREFDARGVLDKRPLEFRPEEPPATPLLFPGHVLADEATGRLFVADSGHNRIVVSGLGGQVQMVVGSGERGFRDGGPRDSAFYLPQGMAVDGDALYVADTWNHAIRRIDLIRGTVETVAGTGEQAVRVKEGPGMTSPLNSPWGLAVHAGVLYIAMAGSHQLWALDPRSGALAKFAGTGREALVDGTRQRATFAQSSGLSTDGRVLYVADSESSSIRGVDLPQTGDQVHILVGEGLFEFGDVDGIDGAVRLQHPLGVAFDPSTGLLYVADSYNNKVKRMDPRTTRTVSLLGSGRPGWGDGIGQLAAFWEPSGLSLGSGKLYVADANNHAVRVVDLATLEVSTVEFVGLGTTRRPEHRPREG